jgi:twitching motility protein PilI
MSKRLNLREFQQSLSNRMQAKDRTGDQASTLGIMIAGQNWLVNMSDISEVLPLPQMTRVPMSKPWFRGVANVRGNLYCVVDMSGYQKKGLLATNNSSRVLLVAEKHGFNAALLVERVFGLRDARAWQQSVEAGSTKYQDGQGIKWKKLDIIDLLNESEFLQVGI